MKRLESIKDQELFDFSGEHLCYECWMLYRVIRLLDEESYRRFSDPVENQVVFNALLESVIVHARILLDFFYGKRLKPDDAIAADYFEKASDWEKLLPPKTPALRDILDRSNKEMAHLSYLRLNVQKDKHPWEIMKVKEGIRALFVLFLEHARSELLHKNLHEFKNI